MPKSWFPGQQENEQVLLVTRPHWIILALKLGVWFLFVLLFLFFDNLVAAPYGLGITLNGPVLAFFKSLYLMFLAGVLFSIWIIYYLNYQIITNERIVDVTQRGLLHHTMSELHLGRIQDVTAEIKGVLGNFLDYGNVYVQTAGEAIRFEFDRVPNPHAVTKLILDLYEKLPTEEKQIKP